MIQFQKYREILAHVTTRMNLEDIMVSEINQSEEDKPCKDSTFNTVKLIETEGRMVVARGWGEGEMTCWLMGLKLQLCKMDKF